MEEIKTLPQYQGHRVDIEEKHLNYKKDEDLYVSQLEELKQKYEKERDQLSSKKWEAKKNISGLLSADTLISFLVEYVQSQVVEQANFLLFKEKSSTKHNWAFGSTLNYSLDPLFSEFHPLLNKFHGRVDLFANTIQIIKEHAEHLFPEWRLLITSKTEVINEYLNLGADEYNEDIEYVITTYALEKK